MNYALAKAGKGSKDGFIFYVRVLQRLVKLRFFGRQRL